MRHYEPYKLYALEQNFKHESRMTGFKFVKRTNSFDDNNGAFTEK